MTRPMAVSGLAFFTALLVLNYAFSSLAFVFFAVLTVLFAVSLFIEKIRRALVVPVALLSASAACLLFFCAESYRCSAACELAGDNVSVTAVLISEMGKDVESGRYRYTLKTSEIGGEKRSLKLRLSTDEPLDADLYDKVCFQGTVYVMAEKNESYNRYFKSKSIFLGSYTFTGIETEKSDSKPPYYYILREKQKSLNILSNLFDDDTAGLLSALLFGDKSLIKAASYEKIRAAGMAHLLAVSGLHMNGWVFFLLMLLRKRGLSARLSGALCCIPVILLAAFSAFSASVVRAGIMMLVYLFGVMSGRKTDALNSLGFASLLIMAVNPYSVCDVSFLLTVTATTGVIFASDRLLTPVDEAIERRVTPGLRRPVRYAADICLVSLSAQAATLPVMVSFFGEIPTYAALSNLLISWLVLPTMLGAGLLTLFGGLAALRLPLVFLLRGCVRLIYLTASAVSALPFSVFRLNASYFAIWLAVALVAASACMLFLKNRRKARGITALCLISALILSQVSYRIVMLDVVKLDVLDVGNGSAVLLTSSGHGCLIGCGGDYFAASAVTKALSDENVTLDIMVLPRDKETETSAAQSVIDAVSPKRLLVCERSLVSLGEEYSGNVEYSDSFDISFCGCSIRVNSLYAVVNAYGTKILISFVPGIGLNTAKTGDINVLISRQSIPVGMAADCFDAVVLSSDRADAAGKKADERLYITGADGAFSVCVRKNKFTLRRCG